MIDRGRQVNPRFESKWWQKVEWDWQKKEEKQRVVYRRRLKM